MTQAKKLKKAIRARARKTGERYTAARRQVLLAREKRRGPSTAAPRLPAPPAPAKSAANPRGLSEASIVKATGHGLGHWFGVLDAFDVRQKGHKAAAEHLYDAHKVPGWHAQMITVEYERDRGLRATNQSCAGDFQVSVSKTVPVPVAEVAAAIADARRRERWLSAADAELARGLNAAFEGPKARQIAMKRDDYARLRYPWDGGTVEIRINGKPKGASVVADNGGLPDAAAVERRREQWRTALESLKAHLTG
jgi:hypothetical protein